MCVCIYICVCVCVCVCVYVCVYIYVCVCVFFFILWAGIVQSVQRHAKGWMVRRSNPSEGEIFRTCPDRPWDTHNFL